MDQTEGAPVAPELLDGVIAACREAGALIRDAFHRGDRETDADGRPAVAGAVAALLADSLGALRPDARLGAPLAGDGAEAFLVEPLDGAAAFLAGRREASVSVALLRGGRPVLGVVHSPLAPDDDGTLLAAAEGIPAGRRARPGEPAVIALAGEGVAGHGAGMAAPRMRTVASVSHALALLAAGEVEAAACLVGPVPTRRLAAGEALLAAAGLSLRDRGGRAVDYRDADVAGFVAGDGNADDLLGRLPPPLEPAAAPAPTRRVRDAARLARAQGCLLGLLAGDALGSAVEFRAARDIARSHPDGVRRLSDGGTWNLVAGQPTDDGEMALAMARAVVRTGGYDMAAVGVAYVDWLRSGPFDMGRTTADGIDAVAAGRRATADTPANGALMRVAPVGILAAGDPAEAARIAEEDARHTHPAAVCRAANRAFAAALAVLIDGAGREAALAAAADHAGTNEAAEAVRARLLAARTGLPDDFQHQMGWVLTAFQNAFFELARGSDPFEGVVATVARGGDTDTNGAICGALLGAADGREAIPLQWRNAVLTCRPVRAAGALRPRPRTFWTDDALDLAEALLATRG